MSLRNIMTVELGAVHKFLREKRIGAVRKLCVSVQVRGEERVAEEQRRSRS
jgi:hypothetical protein